MTSIIKLVIFFVGVFFINFGYSQTINNNLLGQRNFNQKSQLKEFPSEIVVDKTGEVQMLFGTQALKINEQFIYLPSMRVSTKAHVLGLDSLLIPDSTFLMIYGIYDIVTDWMSNKKIIPSPLLSFQISNMPPIGDTALFEFCVVSNQNRDNVHFEPEVYFSDKLEYTGKNLLPKGFNRFLNYGNLPLISKGRTLYHGYLKLIVTKDLVRKQWIHLKIPYTGDPSYAFSKGVIAPFSLLELNEQMDKLSSNSGSVSSINFEIQSTNLSNVNSENLKSSVKSNQGTSKVQISSELANSGDKENAVFLAYLRMEAVREKLIENGIPADKIEVVSPQFKDGQNEELNRVVQVRFL